MNEYSLLRRKEVDKEKYPGKRRSNNYLKKNLKWSHTGCLARMVDRDLQVIKGLQHLRGRAICEHNEPTRVASILDK